MQGSGRIMLWGNFAANGPGALHKVDGIIKKVDYLGILYHNLKLLARKLKLGNNWVFQQDNDPQTHIKSGYRMDKAG